MNDLFPWVYIYVELTTIFQELSIASCVLNPIGLLQSIGIDNYTPKTID